MPDSGSDPRRLSHAALKEIRQELERYPPVDSAKRKPRDTLFREVRADVNPRSLGYDADRGTLTVRWFAGRPPENPPEFVFHYSDSTGFDWGWHNEPNPHVDGWAHYQERESPDDEYAYEPIQFGGETPSRVLWEVLARLEDRLAPH